MPDVRRVATPAVPDKLDYATRSKCLVRFGIPFMRWGTKEITKLLRRFLSDPDYFLLQWHRRESILSALNCLFRLHNSILRLIIKTSWPAIKTITMLLITGSITESEFSSLSDAALSETMERIDAAGNQKRANKGGLVPFFGDDCGHDLIMSDPLSGSGESIRGRSYIFK